MSVYRTEMHVQSVFGAHLSMLALWYPKIAVMKSTAVQTHGELRMRGTANGRSRSLPLVTRGESDKG